MTAALAGWVDSLPRAGFLHAPTPVEHAEALSERLGVRLLVKREDLAGGACGGNKVRKLDYLAATPRAHAADVWLAMGGVQSNWVRETAAAAARRGKQAIAFVRGAEPNGPAAGNVLLDELLGAEVRRYAHVDYGELRAAMASEIDAQGRGGRRGLAFELGGAEPEGVAAWHAAARELVEQLDDPPDAVVVGAGTGSTALGLALGLAEAGCAAPVIGVSASWPVEELSAEAHRLSLLTSEHAGSAPIAVPPTLRWDDREVGEGYTLATVAGRQALIALAREAGIVGDLTYTAKAFAGLCRRVEEGDFGPGATVVFVHTGGAPELFARTQTSIEGRVR